MEIPDDLLQRLVEHFAEMDELARAETMDIDLREFASDVVQQVQIPLLGQLRVMSALHQNLRPAQRNGLLDLLVHLLEGDDIGIVMALHPIECAEFAIDVADIRVVDVAIDDVSDDLVATSAISISLRQLPT